MEETLKNSLTLKYVDICFNDICRICLSRDRLSHNLNDILGETKCIDMFDVFKRLEISLNNDMPSKICEKCVSELKIAYSFEKKAINTQNILINILNSTSITNKNDQTKCETINIALQDNLVSGIVCKASEPIDNEAKNIEHCKANKTIQNTVSNSREKIISFKSNSDVAKNSINKKTGCIKLLPKTTMQVPVDPNILFMNGNILTRGISKQAETKNCYPLININNSKKNESVTQSYVLCNVVSNNATVDIKEIQTSEELFKCPKCSAVFNSKKLCLAHLKSAHVKRIVLSLTKTCSVCSISFETVDKLKEHNMNVHFSKFTPGNRASVKIPCPKCKKICSNMNQLKNHFRIVHSINPSNTNVCKKCNGFFCSVASLKSHSVRCKAFEIFNCNICDGDTFSSVDQYKEHNIEKHGLFICVYCIRGFNSVENLTRHMKSLHDDTSKIFCCVHCPMNFKNRWVLMKHLSQKHNINIGDLMCGMCKDNSQIFYGNKDLLTHMTENHKDYVPDLQMENKKNELTQSENVAMEIKNTTQILNSKTNQEQEISTSTFELKNYQAVTTQNGILTNTNSKITAVKIVCKICSETFSVYENYKKHFASHKNSRKLEESDKPLNQISIETNKKMDRDTEKKDKDGAYLCEICSKRFLRLVNLEKHFSRHMMSSLHCVRCGYNAENANLMEEHLKACRSTQAAEKLICQICDKKLTTAAGLKYHIQTHTDLRKFACPACGRRFLTCTNMRKHIRIVHSGVRPHLCTLCGRRFPSTDHLAKHIRHTHHNKREHVCKECNKKFLQGCHLAQHMWVHTGIKPYSCPHCSNVYSAACSLTKHLRRYHWEIENQKRFEEEKFYENLLETEEQQYSPDDVQSVIIINQIEDGQQKSINKSDQVLESNNKIMKSTEDYALYNTSNFKDLNQTSSEEIYITSEDNEDVSYSIETLQEGEHEDVKEEIVECNENMDVNNENDIIIDGICNDVLREEINVVIVTGEDVMVNSNEYVGQVIW